MEKLALKDLKFDDLEILTREQLKNVIGGSGTMPAGGPGCPASGTQVYMRDQFICGIFTYGDNPPGATDCDGKVDVLAYQPCGWT